MNNNKEFVMLDENIKRKIESYQKHERNPVFLKELDQLISAMNDSELYERFYCNLAFGTAGLRGAIGAGTNRMNSFVVSRATQGIANYLIKTYPDMAKEKKLKAVIAYDSRNNSASFAKTAALIFAGNGIKTYLFSSMRATPELSFAIRRLSCQTGVVITASHNPPEYNGYKAYWKDGVQIREPHDANITEEVEKVVDIHSIDEKHAISNDLLSIIDSEIDKPYFEYLFNMLTEKDAIKKTKDKMKIVYTPLHGVGATFVEKVLKDSSFSLFTVPEQREGDGNFPTVEYPNPEDPKALKLALEYAKKERANIVMATDPDADRFACGVANNEGDITLLTGNQIGVLFFDYLCQTKIRNIKNPCIVRSIVTSHMVDKIAKSHNVSLFECLTGFKWICGLYGKLEKEGKYNYVFGFEESFGYNFWGDVRDKDGILASLMFAELTSYWTEKGQSPLDRLEELFGEYGLFMEHTINKTYTGSEGSATMKAIMKKVRDASFSEIAGIPVLKIRDVWEGVEYESGSSNKKTIDLPKSNVLQYFMKDGSVISIRPSGTEPKIKAYIVSEGVVAPNMTSAKQALQQKLDSYKAFLLSMLGDAK